MPIIDHRKKLVDLLAKAFGPRNTKQPDSDLTKAFDSAVEYLRERYLALPDPGQTHHNCTNCINARLIDDKGLRVEPEELNLTGVGNAIYQCEQLIVELNEVADKLRSEDDEDADDDDDRDQTTIEREEDADHAPGLKAREELRKILDNDPRRREQAQQARASLALLPGQVKAFRDKIAKK